MAKKMRPERGMASRDEKTVGTFPQLRIESRSRIAER